MAILLLVILLAGLVLGTRFKVLILVPATAVIAIAMMTYGIESGGNLRGPLAMALLASACLQVGYLCGAIVRHSVREPRAGNLRRLSVR
jgi:uncharacterized protein YqgC (DUF456 family)